MNESMPENLEELVNQNAANFGFDPKVIEMLRRTVLSGKYLDQLAEAHGLVRIKKKFLWIFSVAEADDKLLARVIAKAKGK